MVNIKDRFNLNTLFLIFTISSLIFSFVSLSSFPFVHSDEVWLADLSRQIITTGDLASTESFFRLTPRYPHAIKTIFHLIQGSFVSINFNILTTRLPSYLAGFASLFFLNLIMKKRMRLSWFAPALLSWNIQFLYLSHFGRQEIFIFLLFVIGLYSIDLELNPIKKGLILGGVISTGIFIHPNIFIIALALGMLLLYRCTTQNYNSIKTKFAQRLISPITYALVLTFAAMLAVAISFYWDGDFLIHYSSFGSQHGTSQPLWLKFRKFPKYVTKMYIQAAGTYYLPNIRATLLVGLGLIIIHPISAKFGNKKFSISSSFEYHILIIGLSLGLIIIGKYSPPSILFYLLPIVIALAEIFSNTTNRWVTWVMILLISTQSFFSVQEILNHKNYSYHDYAEFVKIIPQKDQILGNLNLGYGHDVKNLHPFRDLENLKHSGKSIGEYLSEENIKWIIWPEEMDVVFSERPIWNNLYGNITPYYNDLKAILNEAEIVDSGEFPVYGMRIIPYQHRKGGKVLIYRL